MTRKLAIAGVGILVLLGIAAEEYFRWIGPFRYRTKQIGTVVMLKVCAVEIKDYYDENGEYPLALSDALGEKEWFDGNDRWGNPLLYLSDGKMFVLVSMGRDGQPDGTNYLKARLEDISIDYKRPCPTFDVDQIISDRGWYRSCGK